MLNFDVDVNYDLFSLRPQCFACVGVTAVLVSYWGQSSNVLCVLMYITAATCGALAGAYSVLGSDDRRQVSVPDTLNYLVVLPQPAVRTHT